MGADPDRGPAAPGSRTSRPKRTLGRLALLLFSVAAGDQVLLYTGLSDDSLMGHRVAPFDPPLFQAGQRAAFDSMQRHLQGGAPSEASFHLDAELGWCPTPGLEMHGKHFDWAGCRLSSNALERERVSGLKRIICLGCSFTLGEEVADDESWPYQLDSQQAEVEFANLAVSAYGLDQAIIRYRRDGRPLDGDEVWLGVLPAACLRVASVYRPAERHWTNMVVFKPRFRLDEGGELQLIPCPARNVRELHDLLQSQQDFFDVTREDDLWVRRTPLAYAPRGSSFLHHSALGRLFLTVLEARGRSPLDWLSDRESEVYRLSLAICLQLAREVQADGARFRLIVLPSRAGLESIGSDGLGYWAALTSDLRVAGVEVIDCGQACLDAGMLSGDEFWSPGGHYSARGNRIIAQHLNSWLGP